MVSYGIWNPMKKCFLFTHHPSGTLLVVAVGSLGQGLPQEATRVEGKSAVMNVNIWSVQNCKHCV